MDINQFIKIQHKKLKEHDNEFQKIKKINKERHKEIRKSVLSKEKDFYLNKENRKSDFNLIRKK